MFVRIRRGRARFQSAHKGNHLNCGALVVVDKSGQCAFYGNGAAELLADFTDDGGNRRFARLDLAARKFPFEREMFLGGPLGDQYATGPFDQSTNHGNRGSCDHGLLLNKVLAAAATFLGVPCFQDMKTFLKVSLIIVLSLLAIKFIPFMFLGAMDGLLIAALLGMLGLGLVAALLAVAVALALALSPIWIPVLVVMGVISLFKKLNERPVPPVMTA